MQLEALWAEQPSDGVPRMMARCTRFYRPQVSGGRAGRACITATRTAHVLRLKTAASRRVSLLHYHPPPLRPLQETIFGMPPGPDGLPQLFSSDHVDEAVPLQAVTGKVAVRFGGGAAAAAVDGSGLKSPRRHGGTVEPVFACCFHYDHVAMMLGPPKA